MVDLQVIDVARLLNVSEEKVKGLAEAGSLPSYEMSGEIRFDCTEIESWLMGQPASAFPTSDPSVLVEKRHQFALMRAIHTGEVLHDSTSPSKEAVISSAMESMAKKFNLDHNVLIELLLDREKLAPTGLGNGIAVPHSRDFVMKGHDAITVVFLESPIEYGALDGQPVDTLFFLFACDDQHHLRLLARIAHLCSNPQARAFLATKPEKGALLQYLKEWETHL